MSVFRELALKERLRIYIIGRNKREMLGVA